MSVVWKTLENNKIWICQKRNVLPENCKTELKIVKS